MSLLPHNLQIRDVVICDLQLYRTYVRFGRTDLMRDESSHDDGLTQSFEQWAIATLRYCQSKVRDDANEER